jgi:hypothetical protein
MKSLWKILIGVVLFLLLYHGSAKAQPDTVWTRTYGMSGSETGNCIKPLAGGGYVMVGHTNYQGVTTADYDILMFTIDGAGNPGTWHQTGGDTTDYGYTISQTADGELIHGGSTHSYSGGPYYDVMLLKSGSPSFVFTWGASNGDDRVHSVVQTHDGGYIAAGFTEGLGPSINNVLLVKISATGAKQWHQTFGSNQIEMGYCVQQTYDSGFVVVGLAWSPATWEDVYLIRTDESGDSLWSRLYGDSLTDVGYHVQETIDSGFIITGHTDSYHRSGDRDVYLIRTDKNGDTLWTRALGDTDSLTGMPDQGRYVQETTDGYVIAGHTRAFGAGNQDFYVIKTDFNGDTVWTKTIGGAFNEYCNSAALTPDGGMILLGNTDSFGAGLMDIYAVRLGPGVGVASRTEYDWSVDQPITHLTPGTATITISSSGRAASANSLTRVNIHIDTVFHGATGELTFTLSHLGVTDTLVHQAGGAGANFVGMLLSDASTNPVALGLAPFSGMYRPHKPLTTFQGLDPDGDWVLEVSDDQSGNDGTLRAWGITVLYDVAVGLQPDDATIPADFKLGQNYPNPFNAGTNIQFDLPTPGDVELSVYNLLGRKVATLLSQSLAAGRYDVDWYPSGYPSGMYFYKLAVNDRSLVRKMVLLR